MNVCEFCFHVFEYISPFFIYIIKPFVFRRKHPKSVTLDKASVSSCSNAKEKKYFIPMLPVVVARDCVGVVVVVIIDVQIDTPHILLI